MDEKTNQELRKENFDLKLQKKIDDTAKSEREVSDKSYAPMIIKTIVYVAIGAICLAFINYYAQSIWK
jgi:hypothetical protein